MLRFKNYLGEVVSVETSKSLFSTLDASNLLTPNEVVEDLFNNWDNKSKKEYLAVGFDNLITLHFGFGMSIRNEYCLWHPKYPGVIKGDLGDGHPDGISMKILEALYKRIEAHYSAYDNAMSIFKQEK